MASENSKTSQKGKLCSYFLIDFKLTCYNLPLVNPALHLVVFLDRCHIRVSIYTQRQPPSSRQPIFSSSFFFSTIDILHHARQPALGFVAFLSWRSQIRNIIQDLHQIGVAYGSIDPTTPYSCSSPDKLSRRFGAVGFENIQNPGSTIRAPRRPDPYSDVIDLMWIETTKRRCIQQKNV